MEYFVHLSLSLTTLGGETLAGRNFSGNKIWRKWREFSLADGHKVKYKEFPFFFHKKNFFFPKNEIKLT